MMILCEQTFELVDVVEVDLDGVFFEDLVGKFTHFWSSACNNFIILYLVNQHLGVHSMERIFFMTLYRSSEHRDG